MKCYSCSSRLNEGPVCPACGADVRIYKRIVSASNALYNEGLDKARVRDLSGAVQSLRLSLKYNKKNIDARNLLGLVYFEMGEVVLALSEWIISKNFESKKNIADEYINRLQSSPAALDTISQTLKKFNQALHYCYQDTRDLAVIQLKKILSINKNLIRGYQLLALLYIDAQDYSKARRTLLKSLSIDVNNTTSRHYLKITNEALKEIAEHSEDKRKRRDAIETISYQSGNDTIIQPSIPRERAGMSSIINIVIGVLVGVAICWFLILPSRLDRETSGYDEQYKQVSEELAAEKANSQEITRSLDSLRKENEELKAELDSLTGASGQLTDNDYLEMAAMAYINDPEASTEVIDALSNIDPEYLKGASSGFKALFNKLSDTAGSAAIADYIGKARSAIRQNDYASAIDAYEKAWELDRTDSDMLMNLAHAYRQSGDTKKADELYNEVIRLFPESQNAIDAKDYITAQTESEQAG
ncbi:MAG TPA: hypothetical protein DCL38_08660 [Lachnospiraceae bacterium]|nr:hypothetical protein [Lachnospiraceae bacterium]